MCQVPQNRWSRLTRPERASWVGWVTGEPCRGLTFIFKVAEGFETKTHKITSR